MHMPIALGYMVTHVVLHMFMDVHLAYHPVQTLAVSALWQYEEVPSLHPEWLLHHHLPPAGEKLAVPVLQVRKSFVSAVFKVGHTAAK